MKTSGAGAVMASRREPPDSFDFFPTPPWATRALFVHVLKHLGVDHVNEAYDPACGQGHMAEVFKEFCTFAIASDIFDYGYGVKDIDFLEERSPPRHWQRADWYIFNPPFKLGVEFVLTALQRARIGVAALCRTAWLEGGERYRGLFLPYPPTIFSRRSSSACRW